MKLLDKRTAADAVKLGIFIVVTTIATALLAITIGNLSFGATKTYKAVFTDATGVVKGDDVRIAGVKVGNVTGVEIHNRTQALVELQGRHRHRGHREHPRDDPLPQPGRASATSRSAEGAGGTGVLRRGRHDPAGAHHTGARPDRAVQRLQAAVRGAVARPTSTSSSYELIQVFQGEGGTLEGLLQHTASVTNTLAARDDVIGDLITNLNQTLADRRRPRRGAVRPASSSCAGSSAG